MSNYAIWGLFGPATWAWWLTLLAAAAFATRRHRGAGRILVSLAAGLFVGSAILPLGRWLTIPLENRFPGPVDLRAEHIVVLAGAEDLDASQLAGRPEVTAAAERIIEGAALARQIARADLWIAGGVRRGGASDVAVTLSAWQRLGISRSRIRVVDGTFDTCANAAGVAAHRPQGRMLLVTSALHMPRSMACFRAHGLSPIAYPVDYRAGTSAGAFPPDLLGNISDFDAALHEWAGLLYYRLLGRTRTLFPAPIAD